MKMVRIKIMDGTPCIILEEGIIWFLEKFKQEPESLVMPEYFTDIQESKEKGHYTKILDEIKRKFGEK